MVRELGLVLKLSSHCIAPNKSSSNVVNDEDSIQILLTPSCNVVFMNAGAALYMYIYPGRVSPFLSFLYTWHQQIIGVWF